VGMMRRLLPASIKKRLRRLVYRSEGVRDDLHLGRPTGKHLALPSGVLECVVATNEHGAYCVPCSSRHRPASQAILRSRVWEPETIDLLREADPDADIVHAGTFFGDFLPALARSRQAGTVWAFEPSRENFRCARITALLNDLEHVVLTHAALGAQEGTALLVTRDASGLALGGRSHIVTDRLSAEAELAEEVGVLAIDAVVGEDRQVAVIQLDLEGFEQEALAGAMLTIERCRPLLVLETVPDANWTEAKLAPLGYKVKGSIHGNTVLACC
jgi:FkbM family methyltransferase